MELITETMSEKHFTIYTNEPHTLIFDFLDAISKLGKYIEKKNIYETNGPTKRVHVVFNIIEKFDKKTKIEIEVDLLGIIGNVKYLEIKSKAMIITKISEPKSIFEKAYFNFYNKNLYKKYKEFAKEKINLFDKILIHKTKDFKVIFN